MNIQNTRICAEIAFILGLGFLLVGTLGCQTTETVGGSDCQGEECAGDVALGPTPLSEATPFFGGGETPGEGEEETRFTPDASETIDQSYPLTTAGSCLGACGTEWVEDCSCSPLCGNAGLCCTDYCDACGCGNGEGNDGGAEEEGRKKRRKRGRGRR